MWMFNWVMFWRNIAVLRLRVDLGCWQIGFHFSRQRGRMGEDYLAVFVFPLPLVMVYFETVGNRREIADAIFNAIVEAARESSDCVNSPGCPGPTQSNLDVLASFVGEEAARAMVEELTGSSRADGDRADAADTKSAE